MSCNLQEYKRMLEEAKKYDHRILGQAQELFFFHPLRYPALLTFLFVYPAGLLLHVRHSYLNHAVQGAVSSFHMVQEYIIS